MPGGRTKFQEKWLEVLDGNGDRIGNWCKKWTTETDAYCLLCKCKFSVSNSGVSQVMQHASKQKHKKNIKLLKGQTSLTSSHCIAGETSSVQNLSVSLTVDQSVTRAEALWAMKVAVSDFSFDSCNDIVPLFKIMFEGHPVSNVMQLGERKVSYVLSHGLGPYFHSETVADLKSAIADGGYFTLSFDETTTAQIKKQLDLHVRYWSPRSNKIVTSYLTSLFFGHADAESVCQSIFSAMRADNLPVNKILMLGMDGPNVNLSIAKKLNEELLTKLVDIDTCSLHKVHNSFSKALDELPLNIDEFATDLFSFFKQSAARREDLLKLQKLLECEEKFLIRHVSSRWLTLGPVVGRILSTFTALEEYFLKFLPKQKNMSNLQHNLRYKRIVATLKDPETIVYLEFIAAVTSHLEHYLTLFQTEGPVIHLLYSEMNKLLRTILLKFIKEECVCNLEGKKLRDVDLENFSNYKKLKDLDVGIGTKKALSCLNENKSNEAQMAIRSCLTKLAKSLRESLPLTNSVLKDLELLHPHMREVQTNGIQRLCVNLKPLGMEDGLIDKIVSEWQTYRLDTDVTNICDAFKPESKQGIDMFWREVFQLKETLTGKQKYKNISILVKNCLSLSHGNADVERGFSFNKNILTRNRLNLSESTIIGLRHVKSAVKQYGSIFAVPITGKLLNSVVKSYSLYVAEKEKISKEAEERKKRKCEEQHQQEKAEEIKKCKLGEDLMKKVKHRIFLFAKGINFSK